MQGEVTYAVDMDQCVGTAVLTMARFARRIDVLRFDWLRQVWWTRHRPLVDAVWRQAKLSEADFGARAVRMRLLANTQDTNTKQRVTGSRPRNWRHRSRRN